jgi:putative colanic acid biosysnthesis UDP-glucose lipid carrier transferase
MVIRSKSRSLLQRRKGLISLLQPLLDGVAIISAAWFFGIINIGYLTQDYIILMLVLLGLVSVIYDRYAIYRTSSNFSTKIFNLFNAWTISFLALFLLGFLMKQSHVYSRVFIAELYVFGFLAQVIIHMALRVLTKQLNKHSQVNDNVIIVGQGQLANYLEHKITANPWLNQHVIGNVSIEEEEQTLDRKQQKSELNEYATSRTIQLGRVDELPDLIDEHSITTIYIVTPLESSKVLEDLYFVLLDKHVSIHWIPDIFSLRLINHSVREIAGIPVLTLSETPLTGVSRLAKSIEDILLSVLILLLLSPVLIAVAVAIKLDSPGPIFFRQKRAGWNGKTFSIWKFRSMYAHHVSDKKTLKQAEKVDSRVTKVGAFIRKTSLDELPQLFNVLTGDMSLVGPRPHALQHDEQYSEGVDNYYARHNIKPGITGLAQVRGYRGETKEIDQMTKRIESDIEYINNWSIWLDMSILIRTTKAFTGKSAY